GEAIDLRLELAKRVAQVLMATDQRFAVLLTLRDSVKHVANRGADQRYGCCTMGICQAGIIGQERPLHVLVSLDAREYGLVTARASWKRPNLPDDTRAAELRRRRGIGAIAARRLAGVVRLAFVLNHPGGDLGACPQAELAQDIADVGVRGALCYDELRRNF